GVPDLYRLVPFDECYLVAVAGEGDAVFDSILNRVDGQGEPVLPGQGVADDDGLRRPLCEGAGVGGEVRVGRREGEELFPCIQLPEATTLFRAQADLLPATAEPTGHKAGLLHVEPSNFLASAQVPDAGETVAVDVAEALTGGRKGQLRGGVVRPTVAGEE